MNEQEINNPDFKPLQIWIRNGLNPDNYSLSVRQAFEEFASQEAEKEAKEFAEWLHQNLWQIYHDEDSICYMKKYDDKETDVKSIDELYKQFKLKP